MSKTLIIRLSATGDVAMAIPVVYAVAEANPDDSFVVLTQPFLTSLFVHHPPNVSLLEVNTKTTEKSFLGFLLFALRLRTSGFDHVLDLHNVIRSRVVDFIFCLFGKKVFIVDKCRKERKRLISRPPKVIQPLRPVYLRYADVFRKAGFRFDETFVSLYANQASKPIFEESLFGRKKEYWIGIAPFAKHRGKIYPLEKMEQVVSALSKRDDLKLFLFGGAGEESKTLSSWGKTYDNTVDVASRRLSFDKELALIRLLDVMVSMDSANMHLASLVGTRVISIWGATHPYAGFYGYRQREDLAIQTDLSCRPCSIFGDKRCYRTDWACMNGITPEEVLRKINDTLYQ